MSKLITAKYKLSELAIIDFDGIYNYTLWNFGVIQADLYKEKLKSFFSILAHMPSTGRDYPLVPNTMRAECQHHTIFYIVRDSDILILRILHKKMEHIRYFQ